MRKNIVAGNWKMNLSRDASVELARGLVKQVGELDDVDLAVCPPHVYLETVGDIVKDSAIALGAQNMYHEANGAYTGEISASMLVDLGCRYVILGHSERRHILGETDVEINAKVLAAVTAGLTPIVCVGETLSQREAGTTTDVVVHQLDEALAGLSTEQMMQTVIAYEPVWAIGTGKVATPRQADDVHADLRKSIENHYNTEVAAGLRIQYGGSVKPENAESLLSQTNIDGALVGGASLNADLLSKIISAC